MSVATVPVNDLLHSLVSEQLENDEADPRAIAAVIAESLPDDMLREALAHVLHFYVRSVNRTQAVKRLGQPDSPKWAKAAGMREQVELLRQRVFARGVWKLLGDCDATDCLDMAQRREQQAEANAAKAKQYRVLAGALKQRKAGTVRELPGDALGAIFNA